MNKRIFYSALVPSALAAIIGGYISRCGTEEKPQSPQSDPMAQIDCKSIEDVAQTVVQEYAEKYSLPEHVSGYLAENMCNALLVEQQWGIPAAGVLAKAGSEHSFGTQGDKIKRGNNHFGIKWTEQFNYKYPNCFDAETWEHNPNNKKESCFVAYSSAQQSYLHFGEFLATRDIGGGKNPYEEVMANQQNPTAFLTALARSPYSTNPDELQLTLRILHENHLEEIVSSVKKQSIQSSSQDNLSKDTILKKLKKSKNTEATAEQNPYKRVLYDSALFAVRAYSEGFRQGDFILLEFEPHEKCETTRILFTYTSDKTDKKRKNTMKVPIFKHQGKMYAQVGIDLEYPAQEAGIGLEIACTDDASTIRKITSHYSLEIKERAFNSQELPISKGPSVRETAQQKKAKEKFYDSWKPAITHAYITSGYHIPTDGICDRDNFGSRRIWKHHEKSRHKGVDCEGDAGAPVYAILGGTIAYAHDTPLLFEGIATTINHGYGLSTLYLHQSSHALHEGTIDAGTVHGYIGSTGISTGPHLDVRAKLRFNNGTIMNIDPLSLVIANEVFNK